MRLELYPFIGSSCIFLFFKVHLMAFLPPWALSLLIGVAHGHLRVSSTNPTSLVVARENISAVSSEEAMPVSPSTNSKETKQPEVHLFSFRSCSQQRTKACNTGLFQQLANMSARAAEIPTISRHHLFETLPDEIFEDPKWSAYVMEDKQKGSLTPGRGYWFSKRCL